MKAQVWKACNADDCNFLQKEDNPRRVCPKCGSSMSVLIPDFLVRGTNRMAYSDGWRRGLVIGVLASAAMGACIILLASLFF